MTVHISPVDRSILPVPSLLVTPGSPPDEIPDPFASGDVRSATYNKPIGAGCDTFTPRTPVGRSAVWPDGEPPPTSPALFLGVPRTPVIDGHRRGSSPRGGLKFDTPERAEVEENGLDTHPEVPVLGRGSFGTVVLGKRRGQSTPIRLMNVVLAFHPLNGLINLSPLL